jgi:hypothetical protein
MHRMFTTVSHRSALSISVRYTASVSEALEAEDEPAPGVLDFFAFDFPFPRLPGPGIIAKRASTVKEGDGSRSCKFKRAKL